MNTSNIIKLPIEGMTCASCATRVEKALRRVPGVASAEVTRRMEPAPPTGLKTTAVTMPDDA